MLFANKRNNTNPVTYSIERFTRIPTAGRLSNLVKFTNKKKSLDSRNVESLIREFNSRAFLEGPFGFITLFKPIVFPVASQVPHPERNWKKVIK